MNPLRHTFINSCLHATRSPPPKNLQVLDIGSGGGIFAESAARLPNVRSVTGIDPTPEVFKVAELHKRRDPKLLEKGRLQYLNIGIEDLEDSSAVPAEGYDLITIFEVLEHVSSPSQFLTTASKHLKPGGWLVMSTISRTWTSWMVTKFMAEDVLGIVPRGTHDWDKYVNEYELREWFGKRNGWESPRSMGVMYVPGVGWREVSGGENLGNYFFGIRKAERV
jgi:polyprenyldihydroxybenzoate methyltransferase/3-demethylubiquinol 3-O-methyltransferase